MPGRSIRKILRGVNPPSRAPKAATISHQLCRKSIQRTLIRRCGLSEKVVGNAKADIERWEGGVVGKSGATDKGNEVNMAKVAISLKEANGRQ